MHEHEHPADSADEEDYLDPWEIFCLKLTWILAADNDPALEEAEAILDRGYEGTVTDRDEDRLDEITGAVLDRYHENLDLARFDRIPEDNPDVADLKYSLILLAIIDHIIARDNARFASDIGDDAANYLEDALNFMNRAENDFHDALENLRVLVAGYDESFISGAYKFDEKDD